MKFDPCSELKQWRQTHVYDLCGLVANTKDRSHATVLIRCLRVAAEYLDTRESQEELLGSFDNLVTGTIWHAEPIKDELARLWGWPVSRHETVDPAQMHNHFYEIDSRFSVHKDLDLPGLPNPLTHTGHFSMQDHPYQGHYVAPHHYPYESYLV